MSDSAVAGDLGAKIAEEIRALLARRRMSATQLARRMGVTQSYLARRMIGTQPLDTNDLDRIAQILQVSIVELLPRDRRGHTGATTVGYRHVSAKPASPPRPAARPSVRHAPTGPGRTSRVCP